MHPINFITNVEWARGAVQKQVFRKQKYLIGKNQRRFLTNPFEVRRAHDIRNFRL